LLSLNLSHKKPLEVRMGKGKGSMSHRMACVKGGSILFELCEASKKLKFQFLDPEDPDYL
jgi:ribosomal protein L16/L10AE